ncbi:Glu-tRNA(Gln) amidotransferase subunit GatD [Candidatus Woesearchaeota archaeon]|jgi:glutamyl-tRNA(Gln) amidotransferase subunit D|nr:Glu-tRNA(Gln) amidotransferase subunit GatD [Candidatus Woesearchaeota archaeon]MBT6518713.1 Glu-tRNA(Gln) amidotransferase subunit GatD [Candidatus Woesearchaeota archaeon]MBT7368365.1 Glu-tRNA(Gln) amidotransferase subunit GatD [Candidatus Woesearchaeota archaeon]
MSKDYKEGDKVKVTCKDEVIEGILMPRPDILEEGVIIIKLDHGYNMGIYKNRIEKIELVKEYTKPKIKTQQLKQNKSLPNVSLLSLGGTISSKIDYRTGGVSADFTAEDFIQMCPELLDIANFKAEKVMSVMSEDFNYKDWQKMAEVAAKELNEGADGIIFTQGTDTLHFSTAALSFMLPNLNKPVIFTAAQRSIDRGSSDAFMNLICSAVAASSFDGAEVMTCMHANSDDDYCILIRGSKVRKMHTSRRDAFRPINDLPFAKVWPNKKIEITNKNYRKRNDEPIVPDTKFEPKTALIQVYPGMDPEVIDFYLDKGYKGIVLSATALGHVPTVSKDHTLIPKLERAKKEGIPIVIASQTLYGRTHPFVYTNLRKLSVEVDCIFVEDMLPETALIKLSWVLGHTTDKAEVKKMMLKNIAGEINPIIDEGSYLN